MVRIGISFFTTRSGKGQRTSDEEDNPIHHRYSTRHGHRMAVPRIYHTDKTPIVQRDTIVYRDTIREAYPVEIRNETIDTMLVTIRDTLRIKDILYLTLPMERKVYASDEYYAEVTGYKPSLDYIEVFPKTRIIKETITQSVTNRNALSMGMELGYMNALSLPIYLEYERMLQKNVGIYGRMMYDLNAEQFGVSAGVNIQFEW